MNEKMPENIFQPEVTIFCRQEPISGEHLVNLLSPSGDVKRSPSAKMVYIPELDALAQENLLPDVLAHNTNEDEAEPEDTL